VEPVLVVALGAEDASAIGADELEAGNVIAEGGGDLVILAVDVIGNGAAQRDVLCAGGDRQKESLGDGEVEDLRKRCT